MVKHVYSPLIGKMYNNKNILKRRENRKFLSSKKQVPCLLVFKGDSIHEGVDLYDIQCYKKCNSRHSRLTIFNVANSKHF